MMIMISRLLSSNNYDEINEFQSILFPWLTALVGVIVYYVISRYAYGVPTTAVMFLIGALESPHCVHYEVSMV